MSDLLDKRKNERETINDILNHFIESTIIDSNCTIDDINNFSSNYTKLFLKQVKRYFKIYLSLMKTHTKYEDKLKSYEHIMNLSIRITEYMIYKNTINKGDFYHKKIPVEYPEWLRRVAYKYIKKYTKNHMSNNLDKQSDLKCLLYFSKDNRQISTSIKKTKLASKSNIKLSPKKRMTKLIKNQSIKTKSKKINVITIIDESSV